jgi:hypothetical protein
MYNGLSPTSGLDFSVLWASSGEVDEVAPVSAHQKLNHFPYSKKVVGNKAEFAYIMQRHPPPFFPKTFALPADGRRLYNEMQSNQLSPYIMKPPNGSCGHGIKVITFSDIHSVPHDAAVSQYISRPLCIDKFKFDIRIYALVTSYAPLRAFVSREGLARFATDPYSVVTTNVYSHLTNCTLNKRSRNWTSEFKWKLSDVLSEIQTRFRRQPAEIMDTIRHTVAMTLAIIQPVMADGERRSALPPFFELYGFDLLLDQDFRMWLLEVNTFPALGTDEEVDFEVKGPMIAQVLSIVGVPDGPLDQIPDVQLDDEALLKQEDERNAASGGGFVRIFPDDQFAPLLAPTNIVDQPKSVELPLLDPGKIAKSLTQVQRIDLLVAYLIVLQRRMELERPPRRIQEKVADFLAAQGYQVAPKSPNVRATLQNFIERQQTRAQLAQKRNIWKNGTKDRIMSSGNDFIRQLLLNADLPVRNVRLLFY